MIYINIYQYISIIYINLYQYKSSIAWTSVFWSASRKNWHMYRCRYHQPIWIIPARYLTLIVWFLAFWWIPLWHLQYWSLSSIQYIWRDQRRSISTNREKNQTNTTASLLVLIWAILMALHKSAQLGNRKNSWFSMTEIIFHFGDLIILNIYEYLILRIFKTKKICHDFKNNFKIDVTVSMVLH